MCVIVGDVPNSGIMLRFTQDHACVGISTKPVDMPEDSVRTPQHPISVEERSRCIAAMYGKKVSGEEAKT